MPFTPDNPAAKSGFMPDPEPPKNPFQTSINQDDSLSKLKVSQGVKDFKAKIDKQLSPEGINQVVSSSIIPASASLGVAGKLGVLGRIGIGALQGAGASQGDSEDKATSGVVGGGLQGLLEGAGALGKGAAVAAKTYGSGLAKLGENSDQGLVQYIRSLKLRGLDKVKTIPLLAAQSAAQGVKGAGSSLSGPTGSLNDPKNLAAAMQAIEANKDDQGK